MPALKVALDCGGLHHVLVTPASVELRHDAGERRSRLRHALRRHLRLDVGRPEPLPRRDRRLPPRGGRRLHGALIRRDPDAPAEPGRWALVGGFVHTDAPRGAPWRPGVETARDAVLREIHEEAGLDLAPIAGRLIHVGDFEGGGRDERDTPTAWSRTSLFAVLLDEAHAALPIAGGDDACDARFWPVDALPEPLAFDHARLLAQAVRAMLPA